MSRYLISRYINEKPYGLCAIFHSEIEAEKYLGWLRKFHAVGIRNKEDTRRYVINETEG